MVSQPTLSEIGARHRWKRMPPFRVNAALVVEERQHWETFSRALIGRPDGALLTPARPRRADEGRERTN